MNQGIRFFFGISMLFILSLSHAARTFDIISHPCVAIDGSIYSTCGSGSVENDIAVIANSLPSIIVSTRLFSGPDLYPPSDFAAYGIMSFGARASSYDRARHLMLCEAYVASLPHTFEIDVPNSKQIVTVWPIQSDELAKSLNKAPRHAVCQPAIENYGLVAARQSIADAERTDINLTGVGPHLLAWSPSKDIGKPDALILVVNMSSVTNYNQALEVFELWRKDIESDKTLWENGWDIEALRLAIQHWVDKFGGNIIKIIEAI